MVRGKIEGGFHVCWLWRGSFLGREWDLGDGGPHLYVYKGLEDEDAEEVGAGAEDHGIKNNLVGE